MNNSAILMTIFGFVFLIGGLLFGLSKMKKTGK